METSTDPFSLVERKEYDERKSHQVAEGIWWIGFRDRQSKESHNPYLIVEGNEAALINPGSYAREHHQIVLEKLTAIIDPAQIQHIIVQHHDPQWCAATPHFEKLADRHVRIYAPSAIVKCLQCYGCKNVIIALDEGDSIIMGSGRAITYHDTPDLPLSGSGFFYDFLTGTVFSGDILRCALDQWRLFAPAGHGTFLSPDGEKRASKKAFLHALNKMERLSLQRICPQYGPIMEDDLEEPLAALRKICLANTLSERKTMA